MSTYSAPVEDMIFALTRLADLEAVNTLPGLGEAGPDVVRAVLEEAARLAGEVLAPLNQSGDQAGSRISDRSVVTPPGFVEAYRAYRDGGWASLPFPAALGGQDLPELVATAVNEIWQSANMGFALCPMLTEGAVTALELHGDKYLREVYMPRLVSGQWTATMNLTEPQAGSDLALVKMRAEPRDGHYRLTGQKIFITWGDQDFTENIVHLVLARLPDSPPGSKGLSLFLVPKFLVNADGTLGEHNDVYPVSIEHKMGIHASPTCVMNYGEDGGAVGYLVGKPHDGIAGMFTMMNHARIAVGVQGLSISERAYQQARDYARERVQGRGADGSGPVTIIHHPDVRRMLMFMKSAIEAMRGLCYSTAASMDFLRRADDEAIRGQHSDRLALLTPIVKGWCTELAQEITSLGIQVHGGTGYIEETGAAQHFRDGRITTIYEGTTGIQAADLVGRKIVRDGGESMRRLIEEIRATANVLLDVDGPGLRATAERLSGGIAVLEKATAWLVKSGEGKPEVQGAAAVNYLMLAGTVCGGWQLARSAAAGQKDDGEDRKRMARQVTARFYMEHILPRARGYLDAVMAGPDAVMALAEDQF